MTTPPTTRERPIIFTGRSVRAILEGRKTQTRRIIKPQHKELFEHDDDGNVCFVHAPDCPSYCDYACAAAGEIHDGHIGWTPWGSNPKNRARLWVREAFTYWERREDSDLRPGESRDITKPRGFDRYVKRMANDMCDYLKYICDGTVRPLSEWQYPHPVYEHCIGRFGKKISPIHMPRWASRFTLELVSVRVQRVQEISPHDAWAEGIEPPACHLALECGSDTNFGLGSYDDALSNAAGGKPWGECFCAVEAFSLAWDAIHGKGAWERNDWVWAIEFKRVEQ